MDQAAATTPRPGAFARSASCGVEESFAPEVVPLRWSMVASLSDTIRALSQQESSVVVISGECSEQPFISSDKVGAAARPATSLFGSEVVAAAEPIAGGIEGYVYRNGNKGNGYYLKERQCRIYMMSERYCWLLKKFPVWETIAKKNVEKETLDCGMIIIQDDTPHMLGVNYASLFQIIKFFDTAEFHEEPQVSERLHDIAVSLGGCPELNKFLNPGKKQAKAEDTKAPDADAT